MDDDHGVDLSDMTLAVAYRMAYGFAVRRIERLAIVNVYDRDESNQFDKLVRDTLADMGDAAGPALVAIRLGVADANAGRQPRW